MAKSTSLGGKLFRSTDGTTYTEIPQLLSVTTPGSQAARHDVTDLGNSAKVYISGLTDYSAYPFSVFFDPANTTHQAIRSDQDAGTESYWKIERPEPGVSTVTTYIFQGFVQGFGGPMEVDTPQQMSGELVPTTETTEANGVTAES